MRIDKIMVVYVMFFIALLNCLPLNADSYSDEKKTAFGFRFGSYSFSDVDNDDAYGDDATAISLDLTFPGSNPNISWRIALDGVSSTADIYEDYNNYLTCDLAIGAFTGAVIFHNDRKEKIGVYGGIGLGGYGVTEEGDAVINGDYYIIDGEGTDIGFILFGGISARLSDNFSLGLEYFIRNLKVDMEGPYGDVTNIDYGGQSLLFTLNFSF